MGRRTFWLIAASMIAAATPAAAQDKSPPAKAAQPQAKPQTAPPPLAPTLPDAYKLNLLIRSSIIALNQANQTGNYTVLQDLGAPAFRAANNSARLAQIFGALRQRQLDLSPVLFFTPKLLTEPQIAPNGLLRLVGFFPTEPERVNFDLIYELTGGQWRLLGIAVGTSPAEVTSALPKPGGAEQAPSAPTPVPQSALTEPAANAPRPEAAAPAKAAQKPEAAPRPGRKPRAQRQSGAAKQSGTPAAGQTGTTAQHGATNNAARIDLGNLNAAPSATSTRADAAPEAQPAAAQPKKPDGVRENPNPFSMD